MSKLSGLSQDEFNWVVPADTILLGYRGSIAHGTFVPQSDPNSIDDKDIMGVCIAPLNCYYGLHKFEQREVKLREWDSVVYELRKMVRLLLQCNPNVLALLWLDQKHYIIKTPFGQQLIDHRNLFVSKKAFYAFTGYAYGQLKRMTHLAYEGYMGEKRKALVQKHGYDTKNAAHLIRLLRMGIEFLREGELHVFRHDAQNLLAIKRGEYTLEQVQREADDLFKRIEAAYDASTLPTKPNEDAVEELVMTILEDNFYVERC